MSIEINLLPWRDWRRERRQRRWRVMLLCALLLGVATGYGAERYYASVLDAQRQRHALIERHAQALRPAVLAAERQRRRIADLEQRQAALQEHLDRRAEVLDIFNGLAGTRVDGVRYSALEQREALLVLRGSADSHRRIATQLEALEASSVFAAPSLSEVEPFLGGWRFRLSVVLANWGERSI